MSGKLIMLPVAKGAHLETLSGIQNHDPRVYGRFEDPGVSRAVAYLLAHPSNNFMAHYLIEPICDRGRAILAMNTRYLGNDTMLLMERAIQDLGAGMRFLREQGFRKIVLIGNSGGASLAALYQQQAEKLTITDTPDGQPIELRQQDLPSADAVALLAAHCGRALTLTDSLDPAVLDEMDPGVTNPELDMYDECNPRPYDRQWLAHYRAAQLARNERLTARAQRMIAECPIGDAPFIVYRTKADPRTLDLTLDANDREPGAIWGDARLINQSANGLARFCTARSFLSQWSARLSRAHGPRCLAATSVPVLNASYSADQAAFPSNGAAWSEAAAGRCTEALIRNAPHYPQGNPAIVNQIADLLVQWGG